MATTVGVGGTAAGERPYEGPARGGRDRAGGVAPEVARDVAGCATLVELLRRRAELAPQRVGYRFLGDGADDTCLTYAALDRRARALAATLQDAGAAGARAVLLYQPGIEYVVALYACLYAGVVAVPAYPPHPRRPDPRLRALVEDADAAFAITGGALGARLSEGVRHAPGLTGLRWVDADGVDPSAAAAWTPPAAGPDTLALLQYTSGSTAAPKGVMLTHAALLDNLAAMCAAFGHGPDDVGVSWLPPFHDMGLVGSILEPLYAGFEAVLMAPAAFLQRPVRWLEAIARHRATVSGGPNFAYDLCVERTTPAQRAALDLSTWRRAYNGAEPVRAATLARFADAFAVAGFRAEAFYPCYGLAESTLMVTGGLVHEPPVVRAVDGAALAAHRAVPAAPDTPGAVAVVGSGRPVGAQRVAIVDPETRAPLPDGAVGEVWVSGPSVGAGYWRDAAASAATFGARLATGEGPFLRTGDLGFVLDGELFVTGRRKDLLVLRGRNVYPHDVEHAVAGSHPSLVVGGAAAFAVDVDGEERVAVAAEVSRRHDRSEDEGAVRAVRAAVARALGVRVHAVALLRVGTLPKTSSGKIQRHACRARFLDGTLDAVHVWREPATASDAEETEPGASRSSASSVSSAPSAPSVLSPRPAALADAATSRARADALVAWLREWAESRLDSRLMDERRSIPPSVVLDLGARGLLGLQAPEPLGGLALRHADAARVVEQLAAIDLTLAAFVGGHNSLGLRPLLRHAHPTLRDALAPALAAGRELAALALTEPGAGSNPRALAARAEPDGRGGWRLHGTKLWSGSAGWAAAIHVFARVPADGPGPAGITGFVVRRDAPGVRVGAEALTMGMRGMTQNAVHLDGVRVGPDALLGPVGGGLEVAADTFAHARLGVAAMCVGAMKRCVQLAHRYASRRAVAGGRLLDAPVTRLRLGELVAATAALEALVQAVARRLDDGLPVPEELYAACKTTGPELLWTAADWLVQALGGRGYVETNPAAQLLRDARLLRIFEGPTETLEAWLGARLLGDPTAAARAFGDALAAPEVATRLRDAAARVDARARERSPGRGLDTPAAARAWAASTVGALAGDAALLAAVRDAAAGRPRDARLAAAAAWADARLAERTERALRPTAQEAALLDAAALDGVVADYAAAIGDVEQRSAVHEHGLDPLLRRDGWPGAVRPMAADAEGPRRTERTGNGQGASAAASGASVASAVAPAVAPAGQDAAGRIAAFLRAWVERELGVPAARVRDDVPLPELGLDSMAAVRLLLDLEEVAPGPHDAQLVWAHPDIASLARHLAGRARDGGAAVRRNGDGRDGTVAPDGSGGGMIEVGGGPPRPGEFPEYRALRAQLDALDAAGVANPYFAVHEGVSGAVAVVGGREVANFASYNYLDLSGHPDVVRAAQDAAARWGTSVSASRVASGERPVHRELERAIAAFVGAEDALAFVGGHATNVTTVAHLCGPADLVLCDALAHNSIMQGAALSGARRAVFPHNDWRALDAALAAARGRHRRALVVIEGVYSADGDAPDLARFVDVARRHGALLMVDEAHSLGVLGPTGRGLAEHAGVDPRDVDVWMGTLSKSLASCGGYVAGARELVEWLKYTAPGFVYSVGMTPPNAAAALAALRVLDAEPWRVARLRERVARFLDRARARGLDVGHAGDGAVVPVIVGDSRRAVRAAERLLARGVNVQPMVAPSVAEDGARLRFFLSCAHTDAQVLAAVDATAEVLAELATG